MLSEEQYDEIHHIIRNSGRSANDFEISTSENFDKSEKFHTDVSEVDIKFLPTQMTIRYRSGFACCFLQNFERDLSEGVYDHG